MANGSAPVCPVSRDQPVSNQPPASLLPSVRASDLPSLIQAVNNAISNLNRLLGPGVPTNNLHGPGVFVQPQPVGLAIESNWYEVDRNTNDGNVYNYDSGTQQFNQDMYVEVIRIYDIVLSASGSSVNQPMDWHWDEQPYNDGALQ